MNEQVRIFTLEEAAAKAGLAIQKLQEWLALGILAPAAVAEDNQPVFDESDIVQIQQLRGLAELGYAAGQLKKIARKVGLPAPAEGKKKPRPIEHHLTVGELAKRSNLNPRTIKYWEERGIIEPTMRSEGGFRLYAEHTVLFCSLIHDLQLFGYSLEEIKGVADLFRVFDNLNRHHFAGTREQALAALQDMLDRIQALSTKMDELNQGIERWRKMLKDKRAEVQSLRRRYATEKPKTVSSTLEPAPGESSS